MQRPQYSSCSGCGKQLLFGGVCSSCLDDAAEPMTVEEEIVLYGTEEQVRIMEHGTDEEKKALVAQVTKEQQEATEKRKKDLEAERTYNDDDIPF